MKAITPHNAALVERDALIIARLAGLIATAAEILAQAASHNYVPTPAATKSIRGKTEEILNRMATIENRYGLEKIFSPVDDAGRTTEVHPPEKAGTPDDVETLVTQEDDSRLPLTAWAVEKFRGAEGIEDLVYFVSTYRRQNDASPWRLYERTPFDTRLEASGRFASEIGVTLAEVEEVIEENAADAAERS